MDLDPKNRAEVYYDRILQQLDDISNGTSDSESGSEGLNPVNRAEMYYKMILDKIDEIADGGSGDDIDPAVIEQAVSDWLIAHPEATTTVTDGSITYNKLDTNLKGKTDAVDSLSDEVTDLKSAIVSVEDQIDTETETEEGYTHNSPIDKIIFSYDGLVSSATAKYVTSSNIAEGKLKQSSTNGGVTFGSLGRFASMSDSATGSVNFIPEFNASEHAGKTVNLYVYIHKQNAFVNTGKQLKMQAKVNGANTNLVSKYIHTLNRDGWNVYEDIQLPSENFTNIRVFFDNISGDSFTSGDFIWAGIYTAKATDIGEAVPQEGYTQVVDNIAYVDTMLHKSITKKLVSVKTYVDGHIPDIKTYWTEEIYALPEKFGAVGDGVANDAQALSDCIAYAITSGKAVRGYGKYKTSSPVVLNSQYMDVYLREINYTGNGSAVEIQNMDIHFEFHTITSAGSGIDFTKNSDASPKYARRCRVVGNVLNATGNSILIHGATLYNTVEIRYVVSNNGNCITDMYDSTTDSFKGGEFVFRDISFSCPNGYVTYDVQTFHMYDCTIEGNCKYGLLNPVYSMCIGTRHREQIDGQKHRIIDGSSDNNGALIIFTRNINSDGKYGFKYYTADQLFWFSIDTSAVQGYDEFENGQTNEWQRIAYNAIDLGVPITGTDGTSRKVLAEKVYFIGNNKVFVPGGRCTSIIDTAEVDFSLLESSTDADIVSAKAIVQYLGTDFIIDVSHSDIYFNASFGAIGYNDLTVTQENGNTCTIYDKLGNVLFDGTNEGDGVWSLKCVMDRSSFGRYQATTNWWCYDGTNEKWEITKLS